MRREHALPWMEEIHNECLSLSTPFRKYGLVFFGAVSMAVSQVS
jgi:hypothetical protein